MAIRDSVDLSEDQHAQHDTLRAFLTDQLSSAELRGALEGEPGYRPELHAELAGQLGLSGWTIPEEFGGLGKSQVEACAIHVELGRALYPGPFLPSSVAAGALLATGHREACERWLPQLAAGTVAGTVAAADEAGHWAPGPGGVRADYGTGGWRLSGRRWYVVAAHAAGILVVPAVTESGLAMFLAETGSASLDISRQLDLDLTRRISIITFEAAPAVLLTKDADRGPGPGRARVPDRHRRRGRGRHRLVPGRQPGLRPGAGRVRAPRRLLRGGGQLLRRHARRPGERRGRRPVRRGRDRRRRRRRPEGGPRRGAAGRRLLSPHGRSRDRPVRRHRLHPGARRAAVLPPRLVSRAAVRWSPGPPGRSRRPVIPIGAGASRASRRLSCSRFVAMGDDGQGCRADSGRPLADGGHGPGWVLARRGSARVREQRHHHWSRADQPGRAPAPVLAGHRQRRSPSCWRRATRPSRPSNGR